MKVLAIALTVLLLTVVAAANPVPSDYVYLEAGDGSNCIWPAVGQEFTVTIYFCNPGLVGPGITGFSFAVDRTFGGQKLGEVGLLGEYVLNDDPEVDGMVVFNPECVYPDEHGRIPIAQIEYLYEGPPGVVSMRGHYVDGKAVANCESNLFTWDDSLPESAAGVGQVPPLGCIGSSPARIGSWGAIKALYD